MCSREIYVYIIWERENRGSRVTCGVYSVRAATYIRHDDGDRPQEANKNPKHVGCVITRSLSVSDRTVLQLGLQDRAPSTVSFCYLCGPQTWASAMCIPLLVCRMYVHPDKGRPSIYVVYVCCCHNSSQIYVLLYTLHCIGHMGQRSWAAKTGRSHHPTV